ncbi:MAG: hypothetical protein Q7S64_01760 [bacterium]|nr:hypothetical protein [bacterium]
MNWTRYHAVKIVGCIVVLVVLATAVILGIAIRKHTSVGEILLDDIPTIVKRNSRGVISVTVLDETTDQPIAKATVSNYHGSPSDCVTMVLNPPCPDEDRYDTDSTDPQGRAQVTAYDYDSPSDTTLVYVDASWLHYQNQIVTVERNQKSAVTVRLVKNR